MSALGLLLVLMTGAVAAAIANVLAATLSHRLAESGRYALWTIAFWMGPMGCVLTMGGHLWGSERRVSAPPPAMVDLARTSNHEVLAAFVVALLLLMGAVGAVRLTRVGGAMRKVRRIIRGAAPGREVEPPCGSALPPHAVVLLSDDVSVPAVVGIFRPSVLLPTDAPSLFTAEQLGMILEHESVHVRRHDNLRLWLEELAAAALWWSPATVSARRRVAELRETSCDAAVLAGLKQRARVVYVRTLLGVLGHRPSLSLGYAGRDAAEVRRRMSLILAHEAQRGAGRSWILPAIALSIIAGPVPIVAERAIGAVQASFLLSRPIDVAFQRPNEPGARHRYETTLGANRSLTESLLSPPISEEAGAVDVRPATGGGWSLRTLP